MQVTIGIKHSGRELSLETSASQDEVLEVLAGASTKDVTLADDRGRRVFVPAGSLALTRSEERRVGKECRSRWSPYH